MKTRIKGVVLYHLFSSLHGTQHNIQATKQAYKERTSMTVAAATSGGVVAGGDLWDRGGIGRLKLTIPQQALSPIYFSLYSLSD